MVEKNILLLANQPNEAIVMAQLANKIWEIDSKIPITIVLTDYYTFYFQKQFLNGFKYGFRGEILTQEEIYKQWQDDGNIDKIDLIFMEKWSRSYCEVRSLDQLARTNQWIYGDENSRFLLKTSSKWKSKILFDTIVWCDELISTKSPSLLISLGNETMPTNILFEIARKQAIPFFTIIHTRLQNYWILRRDFALGMDKNTVTAIINKYSTAEHISSAKDFVENLTKTGKSFYPSESEKLAVSTVNKKDSFFKNLYLDLRKFIAGTYWRTFIHNKERPYKVKRVEQNLIKVTYDHFRYLVIFYSRLAGNKFSGARHVPEKRFFLWALHARPESSVLVLGQGKNEIEELLETANQIPEGHFLAVKENPLMLGRRKWGFYKKLRKHKRIILVDPFVSSSDLIKKSVGVIGISGTILLEAAFFDKPSFAYGKPEFVDFLVGSQPMAISSFINQVISKRVSSAKYKVLPYVSYVLLESKKGNLNFNLGIENSDSKEAIIAFAQDIHTYLTKK